MRAETGSSRPSVWDDRPRIDKAGQNRRSDGWNRNNAAAEAEKQRIEAEKQDILADLDMYGI